VARLARARQLSTGEFRKAFTVAGHGTQLAQKDDGRCVFLGPQGCEVHADRPLVCRLYPLGRHLRTDGLEFFTRHEGHPLSEGEFIDRGTVDGFLDAQGAKPFMAAQDRYFEWLCWAHDQLGPAAVSSDATSTEPTDGTDLLDMDGLIARHCAATGKAEPADLDDRLQLHLQLLHDLVANQGDQHATEKSQDRQSEAAP